MFALKSAVIKQIKLRVCKRKFNNIVKFGLDENYVMILYENNPIITDIFIRSQIEQPKQSDNQEEMDALIRIHESSQTSHSRF